MKRYVDPGRQGTPVVLKSNQHFLVIVSVPQKVLNTNLGLTKFTQADEVLSLGTDEKGDHFLMIPASGEKVTKVPGQFVSIRNNHP